jgi:hypothetical protein
MPGSMRVLSWFETVRNKVLVPPPGIEPGSQPSEGRILSIEIQREGRFRPRPEARDYH